MVSTLVCVMRSITGVHSSASGAKASARVCASTDTVVQPSFDSADRRLVT